ncbi:energy transducer TonB [Luteimonas sp. MJ204]|uniref:energy transducer TonB n=1 Tax=Luteimonas sp. MJ145 TaxID=3129234 RepID=UPI0031BA1048
MADPDRNPNTPPPPPQPPPAAGPERRTAAPLLWIVLLLALLAFGWFIYSQRAGVTTAPEALPPPAVEIGDGQDAAAERERAADDARRRTPEPPRPAAPAVTADRGAKPLTRIQPVYPPAAYRDRAQGTVLVSAVVGVDGRPGDVTIASRSGSRDLDRAAIEAVRKWTFQPAISGGDPVSSTVEVPVTFRLDEG